jgi:prepilin-type N-terminal cleavage/methylation domain-containing protein/prepilin-type processing-associated H-X9-DG protein
MNNRRRPGFTLIEMLTVVAVIGILASILTAAAVKSLRMARNAKCKVNLTSLYKAYATRRYDQRLASATTHIAESNWVGRLRGYIQRDEEAFLCSYDANPHFGTSWVQTKGNTQVTNIVYTSYGVNGYPADLFAERKVLLMDYETRLVGVSNIAPKDVLWSDEALFARHTVGRVRKCHVLFCDGSVEAMRPSEIDPGDKGSGAYRKYWTP